MSTDSTDQLLVIDAPRSGVRRIALNRPEALNALSNQLRGELLQRLEEHDRDPQVRVTVLRGIGRAFSAGYDLRADNSENLPFHTADGLGHWPRHVVDGCFRIWDLAKPVIASAEPARSIPAGKRPASASARPACPRAEPEA